MIRIRRELFEERRAYDPGGFLIKSTGYSFDVYYTRISRYRIGGDTLFVMQKEYDYDTPRYTNDTTALRIRNGQILFDRKGRVREKSYDEGNMLFGYKYGNDKITKIVVAY